jgi:type IV secretion system protein VirB10
MTGIIEPGDAAKGTAGGKSEGADQVEPSIIPSVAEHARAGVSTSTKVVFMFIGLALFAALFFVLWRVILPPLHLDVPKVSAPPAVASATGAAKKFDTVPPVAAQAPGSPVDDEGLPAVPGIESAGDDPIGVRATRPNAAHATGAASSSGAPLKPAEDAPVLLARPGAGALGTSAVGAGTAADGNATDPLAETRASLAEYRQQLGRSMDTLQAMIPGAAGPPAGARPASVFASGAPVAGLAAPGQASAGSVGGRGVLGMQASDTPPVRAGMLGNRSLVLPQGTSLTCALTTRVVSAQAGFIGCQVLRNVYGSDGRVLLIERGSHLDGEYRVTQVRPGSTRIPALWTRLRTPGGLTIDLDSPATGPLGESGADAYVDNRWFQRVGAAMLVSILDDSIKIVLNNETAPQQGNNSLVFQGTSQTASQMAEKVLDATINLPPLLYANQGSLVGVYVSRDVDFSSVYEMHPVAP